MVQFETLSDLWVSILRLNHYSTTHGKPVFSVFMCRIFRVRGHLHFIVFHKAAHKDVSLEVSQCIEVIEADN